MDHTLVVAKGEGGDGEGLGVRNQQRQTCPGRLSAGLENNFQTHRISEGSKFIQSEEQK